MAARTTWLQVHADQLLDALGEFGLSLPRQAAASLLQDRVRAVAAQMRITEQSARHRRAPHQHLTQKGARDWDRCAAAG
ncbi:MAG TPA: hypothetical protein VGJ54_11715 [Streptosporangiaceae bacterium]